MFTFEELKRSFLVSIWFVFLTFPIMVIRVDSIEKTVQWRWMNMVYVAIGSFVLSYVFRYMMQRKEMKSEDNGDGDKKDKTGRSFIHRWLADPKYRNPILVSLLAAAIIFPHVFSTYQTSIMTTALMYVVLGLGLNIVVGLAGLLDLGYVAFYAVGAYTYALLYHFFGVGFWIALPIGGLLAALFGILLVSRFLD